MNYVTIELEVNNQLLRRVDDETILSKSKNIQKTLFHFKNPEFYQGLNIFAIFTDSWGEKTTIHLGKNATELSSIIPSRVLKGTYFKISLYAGDLIATNNVTIPLLGSGYSSSYQHGCSREGKDIFVEIFDKIDGKINTISFTGKCLELYSESELLDSVCLNGLVDEAYLDELMQEYVTKIELKSFLESEGYIKNLDFNFETGELTFEK